MNGGNQYYVSGREVDKCQCNEVTFSGAPVMILPGADDSVSNLLDRSVHEYTHAFQLSRGGPMPSWMMEGGAVFNECLFAELANDSTFSACMNNGIIWNVRELYLRDPTMDWFTEYATDRCCDSHCPGGLASTAPLSDDDDRSVYYDMGAFAITFLLNEANVTAADFWTSKSKGFWQHEDLVYPDIDKMTGWATDVPEGSGWKAALSHVWGKGTAAEFYAKFEEFMVGADGTVVSLAAMEAVFLPDDAAAEQSRIKVDVSSADYDKEKKLPEGCSGVSSLRLNAAICAVLGAFTVFLASDFI